MMADARTRRRYLLNNVMIGLTGTCTFLTVSILFVILGYLLYNGGKSLDWNFLTKLPLPPGETGGGMANAIVGSAKMVMVAAFIGVPIGFLGGIYLAEFGGNIMPHLIRYVADLLNGVPSIVIGIFTSILIVKTTKRFSAWGGGFALSLILIPITIRTTEQFLRAVPDNLREGALALGASRWSTVFTVVVPASLSGVLTGVILGVARIAGETAPLLFTCLNNQFWSEGLNEPTASLPVMIYTHAIGPYDDWHRQAWAAGLVLLAMVLASNVAARLILAKGMARR